MIPFLKPTRWDVTIEHISSKFLKILAMTFLAAWICLYTTGYYECKQSCIEKDMVFEKFEWIFGSRFRPESNLCSCCNKSGETIKFTQL